jgi:hypothetical protein
MAAATMAPVEKVVRNTEFLGQRPRYVKILLMGSGAHVVMFHRFEGGEQFLLVSVIEQSSGHRKEHLILFLDVCTQKFYVTGGLFGEVPDSVGVATGGLFDPVGHAADEGASQLVLVEHHTHRTVLARHPFGREGGEEQVFFFAVMAAVGKIAQEIERGESGRAVKAVPLDRLNGHSLEAVEDYLDDPMLARKYVGRLHSNLLGIR